MKIPAVFLATALAAHATTFSLTTATIAPGYSVSDGVTIALTSTVTFSGPGTYSAESWSITGDVRLASPGEYEIVARSGTINLGLTGSIRGPASGSATLRLVSTRPVSYSGSISANITVVEAVEVPPPAPAGAAPLLNISTRATLAAGQVLNPGFVIGGTVSRRVLVRAIGPTLAAFGVPSPMAAPSLQVFSGQNQIAAANSGWGGGTALSTVFSAVGAFALPANSLDAAVVLTLAPGNYTARIAGGAGEVLAEVYFVD